MTKKKMATKHDDTQATERAAHTPGPWTACFMLAENRVIGFHITSPLYGSTRAVCETRYNLAAPDIEANARLIAAAPDLLAALLNVRKIISEASMTGFNCHTGDWAERLFASQSVSSRAIARATRGQS